MATNESGLCSIIIPVFNREWSIVDAIESCLAQDYPNIEVVVVDDGSTDRSTDLCLQYAKRYSQAQRRVVYVRQQNAGACAARNHGMALATGEFLLFLDSDDLIPPTKLSRQIRPMQEQGTDCSICDFQTIDHDGNPLHVYSNNRAPREFITQFKSPSNSAIVMRRSTVPVGLRWNTSLARMQDFDFMLRYLSGVKTWSYISEPLYLYRIHTGQRISDSYLQGMPYLEMVKSMRSHLAQHPPASTSAAYLLARYSLSIFRWYLQDTASRSAPRLLIQTYKALRRRIYSVIG